MKCVKFISVLFINREVEGMVDEGRVITGVGDPHHAGQYDSCLDFTYGIRLVE